ncbi:hypothetical protein KP509_1Z168300 [Ceratopteris richardii]|nr:hypothetical protein KP509_1Z168300 [Ceratopteris richardii]
MTRGNLHHSPAFLSQNGGHNITSTAHRLVGLSLGEAARPHVSFPVETGLVVFLILFVSALFSYCYHAFQLIKARRMSASSASLDNSDDDSFGAQQDSLSPQTLSYDVSSVLDTTTKMNAVACAPIVFMAGEEMPRFIAVPRPLDTASTETLAGSYENITIRVSPDGKLTMNP